jgi:hypothetical protein
MCLYKVWDCGTLENQLDQLAWDENDETTVYKAMIPVPKYEVSRFDDTKQWKPAFYEDGEPALVEGQLSPKAKEYNKRRTLLNPISPGYDRTVYKVGYHCWVSLYDAESWTRGENKPWRIYQTISCKIRRKDVCAGGHDIRNKKVLVAKYITIVGAV